MHFLALVALAAFLPPTEVKNGQAYDGGIKGPLVHGTNGTAAVPVAVTDAGVVLTYRTVDPQEMSAFGEMRISSPYTLFDMGSGRYGRDSREVAAIAGDGGTVVNVQRASGFQLSVDGSNTAYARARTNTWFRYQAGRGQLATMTVTQDACPLGQTRRWGYFDGHDGLYFQVKDGVLAVVRRTATPENVSCTGCHQTDGGSKATYEQVVTQANWNKNTYPTLDPTKGNIWQVQFQWLGVGVVKFFVNGILVHEMDHPNTLNYPYMSSATLPLTWEVVNDSTADAGSLTAICANVTSQSGQAPPEYSYAYSTGGVAVGLTEIPIVSIRPTQLLSGVGNRVLVLPKAITVSNGETVAGRIVRIRVYMNATLTNATWANVIGGGSGVEADTAASAVSGGELVASFSVAASNTGELNLTEAFGEVERKLRRDGFTGTADTLTVTALYTATGGTMYSSIRWVELK